MTGSGVLDRKMDAPVGAEIATAARPGRAPGEGLVVEEAPVPALREEWEALLPRARAGSVFVTWDFLATWWEHFRRSRRGRTLLVREPDGRPVAILPFYVERLATRFGEARVLRNVGYADVVNPDFLDVLVEQGREEEVADLVAPLLFDAPDWDFVEFSELDPEGSLPVMARRWARTRGLALLVEPRATCPYVPLPASFEEYLMGRNAHFRHQLRRYRRKIQRELGVTWKRVGVDLDVGTGIAQLAALHQERMEATARGGNFRKDDYRHFHRVLAERLARSGRLYFWVLFVEGTPIATHYGFLHDGVYFGYQMGFTPRFARYSPGHYMTGVVLEKLIEEEHAREMNLLRGTDAWKYRWTDRERRTVTVRLLPGSWRSRWAYLGAALSQSPPLVLRFLLGRENFEELRRCWKAARERVRPAGS